MVYILKGKPQSTNMIYRRHGFIIHMSNKGKKLKDDYIKQLKEQYTSIPITSELKIALGLYFDDKRIRDIDNYNKIILDACKGIIWEDDKQIQTLTISKFYDKNNPRIELTIL